MECQVYTSMSKKEVSARGESLAETPDPALKVSQALVSRAKMPGPLEQALLIGGGELVPAQAFESAKIEFSKLLVG